MPLLARLSIAWLAGVALAHGLNPPWPVVVLLSLPALAALFLYRDAPHTRITAILALAFVAGAFRLVFFQPTIDSSHIAFLHDAPQPVSVTGTVADEPDVRDVYTNLRLETETIQRGDNVQPVHGLLCECRATPLSPTATV